MPGAPDAFIFSQVPDTAAGEAFAFHQSVAASDPHLMPRSEGEIQDFANKGELFGARNASSGEFIALCYATLEDAKHEWEIGGLAVIPETQKLGIGTVLVRFALCSIIANERPWHFGDEIIAYVHEENPKPRNLLKSIGFEPISGPNGLLTIPGHLAPPSMKRNSGGNVVGHKFKLPRSAVRQLADWFIRDFSGVLLDGETRAIFEVRPAGPDSLKQDLQREVEELDMK
jgi:GNAT superfamily N-acetyltransferase